MKPVYILLFISFFFSTELFSQSGLGVMVDRAQQAFTDLANRSKRTPKPANIQGTHYFNERFEVATLDYFGTELNDKGFMRYNAFRDEVEMASTTSQNESDLVLMKSNDIVPYIGGEKYLYIPHRLEDGRAYIGYLVLLHQGKNHTVYIKRQKVFMEIPPWRLSQNRKFFEQRISFSVFTIYYIRFGKHWKLYTICVFAKLSNFLI